MIIVNVNAFNYQNINNYLFFNVFIVDCTIEFVVMIILANILARLNIARCRFILF